METVLQIFVLATAGAILAIVIAEFAKNDPNKDTGAFGRFKKTWAWAITNAYGKTQN